MSGIAMFTMVRSRRVKKKPRPRVSRTAHSLPRHLLTVLLIVARSFRFAVQGTWALLPRRRHPGEPPLADVVGDRAEPVAFRPEQGREVLHLDEAHPLEGRRPLLERGVQRDLKAAELCLDRHGPTFQQLADLLRGEQRR